MTRRTPRWILLGLFAALTLACSGKGVDTGETGFNLCDASTPELGAGGGDFATEAVDFTWSGGVGWAEGPWIARRLPSDVLSFGVTVDAGGESVGFRALSLDDTIFIDSYRDVGDDGAWDGAPLFTWHTPAGAVVLPINPQSEPWGGACLTVAPEAVSNLDGESGTLRFTLRRGQAGGVVDVNVVLVGEVELFQDELDEAVARLDELWSKEGGPSVGEVTTFAVDGDDTPRFNSLNDILATPVDGAEQAMTFFMISYFSDDAGTLGVAGGIPGPVAVPGTAASGVVVAVDEHLNGRGDALLTELMGETMAHEGGHQMGLFHTTESDGVSYDILDDTALCPSSADSDGDGEYTAEECSDYDGRNFMFWTAGSFSQDEVSATQAWVLSVSPAAR
ncbi:MAG: hypothetical protein H6741_28905 [Alphaproteobacteria bacterium]|nr:hypothetical protein [Alphaproteobacteria bacterium]